MCALNSVRLAPGSLLPEGFGPAATRCGWHTRLPRPRWATLFVLGLALFFAAAFFSSAGIITTYAGGGGSTADGIPATNAVIGVGGLAVDPAGNLYIADAPVVRRVDHATGLITTFAGGATQGFSGDGGLATNALFYSPMSLAADLGGNLYVCDWIDARIRKIDLSSGTITTVAGNGIPAYAGDGGQATNASLLNPQGVAVDVHGNIYVAEWAVAVVRKVEAKTGIIRTVAGKWPNLGYAGDGGPATNASLSLPERLAVDVFGNLFILDSDTHTHIRRVDGQTGIITTLAGGGAGDGSSGLATNANLSLANDLAVDNLGGLYVGGLSNVWKVDLNVGTISIIAGGATQGFAGDGGPANNALLDGVAGIAVSGAGDIYLSDGNNLHVRRITPDTVPPYGVLVDLTTTPTFLDPMPAVQDRLGLATVNGRFSLVVPNGTHATAGLTVSGTNGLAILGITGTNSLSLAGLTDYGGSLTLSGLTNLNSIDLTTVTNIGGSLTLTGNGSSRVFVGSPSVSGNITLSQNGSGGITVGSPTAGGSVTITNNGTGGITVGSGSGGSISNGITQNGSGGISVGAGGGGTVNIGVTENGSGGIIVGAGAGGSVNIGVTQNGTGGITVSAGPGGTVSIGVTQNGSGGFSIGAGGNGTVNIGVTQNGSGGVTIGGTANSVVLTNNGIGVVTVGGTNGSVGVTVNGSGGITVGGTAGSVIVTNNGTGVVTVGGATVTGDVTISGSGTNSTTLTGSSIGGNLGVSLAGGASADVSGAQTAGNVTVTTSGSSTFVAATGGGTTAVSMTNGPAALNATLPTNTFTTNVSFSVQAVAPTNGVAAAGTAPDGTLTSVTPVAQYQFSFAIPTLNQNASLTFDITLAALDTASRAAFLTALNAGAATVAVIGDAPGSLWQTFPICGTGQLPSPGGCVSVVLLDGAGTPLPPGSTNAPAVVRFTGVAGHFSTWGVVLFQAGVPPVHLETSLLGNGTLRLSWTGPPSGVLETSTNLAPNSWTPAGAPTQQPNGSWRLELSPTDPARFYRLKAQ